MCGILGYLGKFDQEAFRSGLRCIAHRGPDDSGVFVDAASGVGLGHARLSIIDLSPLGHQPMADETGRVQLVFNGEIYNYRELRADLESKGHRFKGHSDTEVLLHLYLEQGAAMLPRLNGFEVAKRLRAGESTRSIPLLILSAKGESESRIKGLELGADDYLPKPFSPRELVLRIQSLLRRSAPPAIADDSSAGPFVLDRTTLKVTMEGKRLDLTSTEFKLLSLLIGKAGVIQSREDLLTEVWGYKSTVDTRTVDTHMRRLREKLADHSACLETVRGEGYRFIVPSA